MFAGGLSIGAYNQIVTAASEAATLAVMRAMQQLETEAVRPARLGQSGGGLPDEPDNPSPDGNEPETGGLEPFECMYSNTTFLQIA